MAIGFRPTDDDKRIIGRFKRQGETTSDVLRRGLRSLEQVDWVERARADMARLALEDLSEEPDDWEYDEAGNIKDVGTGSVLKARNEGGW